MRCRHWQRYILGEHAECLMGVEGLQLNKQCDKTDLLTVVDKCAGYDYSLIRICDVHCYQASHPHLLGAGQMAAAR